MSDAPVAVSKPKRGRPSKAEIAAREAAKVGDSEASEIRQSEQPSPELAGGILGEGSDGQDDAGSQDNGPPLTEAQVEALDHDGDGNPGGSLPHKLPPREIVGLCREALEAYEMQDDRQRTDTLRRKWVFRPGRVRDHASLMLSCQRGEHREELHIMGDQMGVAGREAAIEAAVMGLVDSV